MTSTYNNGSITTTTSNGKNYSHSSSSSSSSPSSLAIATQHGNVTFSDSPASTSNSSTSSSNSSTITRDSSSTNTRKKIQKFEPILNQTVDTQKIDLRRIESWLLSHIRDNYSTRQSKLICDLIMDFLKSERYPDGKVLQCSFIDLGILNLARLKKLMKSLWDKLLDEQDFACYKKYKLVQESTTSRSSSTSLARVSGYSKNDYFELDNNNHHNYSGTRDARKSVNTK